MKLRSLIALALALSCAHAHAQSNQGSSPLSGPKGGTNNAYMQFTGPGGTLKTFTLPNVSGTLAMLSQAQTWTGLQTFLSQVAISGSPGSARNFVLQSNFSTRWVFAADSAAEAGSNAGSNLVIAAFSDAGVYLSTPFSISRSSGIVAFANGLTSSGPLNAASWSYLTGNNSGAYPSAGFGGAQGVNFSSGSGEITSWNLYLAAGKSFNWRQMTGASSSTDLMSLYPNGNLDAAGNINTATIFASKGKGVIDSDGAANNFTRIYDGSGNLSVFVGGSSDPSIYYRNTRHFFQNIGGSQSYGLIDQNGLYLYGATSNGARIQSAASGSGGVWTLPQVTDQFVGRATPDTLTNKAINCGSSGNVCAGTASGLTAGNVTTNANLAGAVTSVGNATSLGSFSSANLLAALSTKTGTGFSVFDTAPTIWGLTTTGVENNQGTLKLSSFVTATQLTANANDYTASDGSSTCSTKLTLRISTNASRNITGLSCGQAEGDIRIVHNTGPNPAVLTNEDVASLASNRLALGGDLSLAAGYSITLRYDGVSSRWRAIMTPGAGGGGGGGGSVTIAPGAGIAVSGSCIGVGTSTGTCVINQASPGDVPLMALALSDATANYVALGATFADNFKSLGLVDTSGATNLNSSESGYLKPTTSSPTYSNAASSSVASDTGSFSGNTVRQIINAAQIAVNGNGQVRVSIKAGSSGATIARVYVAMAAASGDTYDFQSAPVQLLNGGSAGATLGATVTGTWSAPFNLEASKNLVIAYELTAGSLPFQTTLTGWQAWFKSGTDATTVNATGYTSSQAALGVSLVEYSALPASSNLTVASQILPASIVPSKITGYIRVVPTDALTLGTDFMVDVSRDGSTWATGGTLSLLFNDGGTSVLSLAPVDVTAQPSGSSPRWRVRSANSKAFKVDGIALALTP